MPHKRQEWGQAVLALSLLCACTSTPSGTQAEPGAGNGGASNAPFLAPAALKELEGLGFRKYEGKAVATREDPETPTAPARVTFDADSGPICIFGAPFSAFYADRHSDDLVILLDPGGACWSGLCSATEVVKDTVSDFVGALAYPGIVGAPLTSHTGSDFRTWNMVSVPYCDGSVFMGDNEVTNDVFALNAQPAGTGVRYHHGRQNLAAALDLAVQHFPNPKRVLLGGISAGGYGTLTAMIATRLRYPEASLFVFDDSGPGIFNLAATDDMEARLAEWRFGGAVPESCTDCKGGRGQLAPLFSWMLERDRGIHISVASFAQDLVLAADLRFSVEDYEALLRPTLASIRHADPDRFKRFLVPEKGHALSFNWPDATADSVHLDEWVVAMADGNDAEWKDIDAANRYLCPHPDAATCATHPECSVLLGKPAGGGPPVFAGCVATASCVEGIACATSSESHQCLEFPTSCIPSGWDSVPCDMLGCPGRPFVATLPNCDLETVIAYVSEGAGGTDCGTLDAHSATVTEKAEASACVTDAQTKKQPYRVFWGEQTFEVALNDSSDTHGVLSGMLSKQGASVGVQKGNAFDVYRFDHLQETPVGPSLDVPPAKVSWSVCRTSGVEACTPENGPLCLACDPDPTTQFGTGYAPAGLAGHCSCVPNTFGGDGKIVVCD